MLPGAGIGEIRRVAVQGAEGEFFGWLVCYRGLRLAVAGRCHGPHRNLVRIIEINRAEIELDLVYHLSAPADGKPQLGRGIGGKLHAVRLALEIEWAAVDLDA